MVGILGSITMHQKGMMNDQCYQSCMGKMGDMMKSGMMHGKGKMGDMNNNASNNNDHSSHH